MWRNLTKILGVELQLIVHERVERGKIIIEVLEVLDPVVHPRATSHLFHIVQSWCVDKMEFPEVTPKFERREWHAHVAPTAKVATTQVGGANRFTATEVLSNKGLDVAPRPGMDVECILCKPPVR